MKTNTQPKLHISLSKEHNKYQSEVADAFKGLDISFDGGLMRFSAEEMAMQVILNLGIGIASSAMWDVIKLGIKKLHKKFTTAHITLRDAESVMYTVKPDLSVTVLVVPDRMKEFEHIKTFNDLVSHLKKESVSVNSAGWKETKLADIGVFSKGSGITKDQLTKTGHNAIRYGELYTKFDFKIENIYSHIPTEILPTTTKIKYGDILLAGSGETNEEIGKSASYLLHEDCYAGGDLIIFSPKNANSLFLSYFLNIGEGRKKLTELGQGQSVVHIYKSEVEKLKLHLPSLPEQGRIVSVVETWDKSIGKIAQKIIIKEEIKKGLVQSLLSGKKRLAGFSEKWEFKILGEICEIKRGGSPRPIQNYITESKDGLNWLRIGDVPIGDRYIYETSEKIKKEGLNKTTLVKEGDFILSNSMSFGRPYIMKTEACIHDGWLALMNVSSAINKDFLYYLLSSPKTQSVFRSISAGSGVLNLKKETVSEVVIEIPKLKEQTAIANILTTTDNEIDSLKKKLSIIKDQKRYLLNNLITGTIRTPETLSTKLTK